MPNPDSEHLQGVANALCAGRLVPFLGAGASLAGRPKDLKWEPGPYLPRASELAEYLGNQIWQTPVELQGDLPRASQYIAMKAGNGPIFEELHRIFSSPYGPRPLQQLLVKVERTLARREPTKHLLVITTNYDDTVEQAFMEDGVAFDVVTYMAHGQAQGFFVHRRSERSEASAEVIRKPNEYTGLLDKRPVIFKIHGAVDREESTWESFVITEDHFIDFLARADLPLLIPGEILARLKISGLLFLGYRLKDWNLRVIFRRIWGDQPVDYKSYAVDRSVTELDHLFWQKHNVELIEAELSDYVTQLAIRLGAGTAS